MSSKLDYDTYIQSPEWKAKAEAAKDRVGRRCQICNCDESVDYLNAHHRTYERLGNEDPFDLTVLCRDCHAMYEHTRMVSQLHPDQQLQYITRMAGRRIR